MANRGTDAKTNIAMILLEMKQEVFDKTLFAPYTGRVSVEYEFDQSGKGVKSKEIVLSGQIVEMMEDWALKVNGRWADSIEIPLRKNLTGKPMYGDQWIEKTGEDMVYEWQKAYINLMSKTVMQKRGVMDYLRDEAVYELLESSQEAITTWMHIQLNAQAVSALFEGTSLNITAPIKDSPNGIGLKKILPSNVYYNTATGQVSVGTAGYNKTEAQLNAAASTYTTMTKLTSLSLIQLKALAKDRKIKPSVPYKGSMLYLYIISDADLINLLSEEVFRETAQRADMGKGDESRYIIPPDVWIYMGFMLIADDKVARKWSAKGFAGTADDYTADPATALPDHNYTILLGAGALFYAVENSVNMYLNKEEFNHKQQKELALLHVFGYNRMESVAEADEASYWVKNQSTASYLASTYSVTNQSVLFVITAP